MVPFICSIIVIGDSQGYINPFEDVVNYIIENEQPSSTIIHAGDIFDELINNDTEQIEQINKLRNYFASSIIVRGNHDPIDIFEENFDTLPFIQDMCENATIIAIDSNRYKVRQLNYIKEQIDRRPDRIYVVVLHHHLQACSTGDIGPTFWKAALENTLRSNDLIIHGHSHTENSYHLNNGTLVLSTSSANIKRYQCLNNTDCTCDNSSNLSYLKIELTESGWNYNRVTIQNSDTH